MIMFIDFIKCELHHLVFVFQVRHGFHGPISSKKKSGIGCKQKNGSSFQRHKDAIAKTESVYQPPAETPSTETTQPSQKRRADNQWRAASGIAS